ncbi:hypothetical protein QAD02_019118 [Eretmocerus hayati]|uniref:Uncharacterized protein n=1 Tax=Eretmocerus hayati TaxID=131215 RepID=A0ACC2PJW1_9HYME|nr:hypothetical protein QAD02_019118 [Eretmocerus hayati]
MTQSSLVPPFTNLETLFYNTDYIVLLRNSTAAQRAFKERYEPIIEEIVEAGRYRYYSEKFDFVSMWNDACSDDVNGAAFHFPYLKPNIASEDVSCNLEAVGQSRYSVCITAVIPKNFMYKKTINYGIIRLHESGLIDSLKSRWLKSF